jgi:hypothetical protein
VHRGNALTVPNVQRMREGTECSRKPSVTPVLGICRSKDPVRNKGEEHSLCSGRPAKHQQTAGRDPTAPDANGNARP